MPYNILYLDEAKTDVKAAKTWYKNQRNGLQKQFAQEVTKAISLLQNFPQVYAIRYRNIRVVHTKVFPFGIHFYINDISKVVTITAIVHDFRDVASVMDRS